MPDDSDLPAGLPLSLFWSILLENVVLWRDLKVLLIGGPGDIRGIGCLWYER
jgi:hypothetical protein